MGKILLKLSINLVSIIWILLRWLSIAWLEEKILPYLQVIAKWIGVPMVAVEGFLVGVIFLASIWWIISSIRKQKLNQSEATKELEDIKSALITMNAYESEVATRKANQQCPENIAKQIHDDFFVIFDARAFMSILQRAIENDIDPLIDFFKKFGDILDGNEYGLKVELEDTEPYKSSRMDLAQKRQKLHTAKKRRAITQENINRVCSLTYGLNSSILLRGVLRSAPKTNGIVHPAIRIVLVSLEGIETLIENSLTEMLDNLENEWKVKVDTAKFDTTQLQTLLSLLSTLKETK